MTITFYLKEPNAEKETPLYIRVLLNDDKRGKIYLSEKINPKHWNQAKQEARKTLFGATTFNDLLKVRKGQINDCYRNWITAHQTEPTPTQLLAEVKKVLRPDAKAEMEKAQRETLLGFFGYFLTISKNGTRTTREGQPVTAATIRNYQTTFNTLRDFETFKKKAHRLEEIDQPFYNDFTGYLTLQKRLSPNSIGKHIRILKTLLNDAVTSEIIPPLSPIKMKGFRAYNGETETIFLDETELKELQDLDLSDAPRLARVRDLFLIGANTGARFSDWDKITPANIGADGMLSIRAEKTKKPVSIPVLPTVKRLFEKYGDEMPRLPTNQKVNAFLKEIGKRAACLQKTISRTVTKGGVTDKKDCPKWELLTTHTARRSFATNAYKRGLSAKTIMAVTGHTTEASFYRYIRLTDADHARIIQDAFNA